MEIPADFDENKHFQFGTTNPTLMEKPFWKYMICNPHLTAFCVAGARDQELPIYCFARFGATQTYLEDGRLICIGGEHEDSHDPDFQIYNDVVVIKNPHFVKAIIYKTPVPSNFPTKAGGGYNLPLESRMLGTSNVNDVTIYGYAKDVFPPTDFHTATYVQHKDGKKFIYIIGGTGCESNGRFEEGSTNEEDCIANHLENTRIFRLDLSDFSMQKIQTSGDIPKGCSTHLHSAKLTMVEGQQLIEIEISQESVENCMQEQLCRNGTVMGDHHLRYRLNLENCVWTIYNRK